MSFRSTPPRYLIVRRRALAAAWLTATIALAACAPLPPEPTERADRAPGTTHQALSTCVVAPTLGDTTLADPPMTKNFGDRPILQVGNQDEALLRFDLSAIPASASLDRATMTVTIAGEDDGEDGGDDVCLGNAPHRCPTLTVHGALAPWSEAGVTFASFGQRFDAAPLGSFQVTSAQAAKSVDLTAAVRAWLSGAKPSDGVVLTTSSRRKTTLVSREGARPEQRPRLDVCYTMQTDYCATRPCQNGGTCSNQPTGYTCACPPGYQGTQCETLIDNCASAPCQNGGACTNGVGSYTCACPAGFTGKNCEINVDDCASAPCMNGGVCEDGIASFTCHCAPGYTGPTCATLIDNCASSPCQNGGTCTNGVASYTCSCPAGFTGQHCETNVDDCVGNACKNGATCIDGVNAYTCACPPDWGGTYCDVDLNECAQGPCLHGATCANGAGTYTCTCAPGYTGTNCEIDINDCASNPCENGGLCVDGVNQYTCTCPNGFVGTNCDRALVATVPADAANPGLWHTILSGAPTTLKGVTGVVNGQYVWDFGDGSSQYRATITDPNNLSVRHTYQGVPGQVVLAKLTVQSATGQAATATYAMRVADPKEDPDPRLAIAVDEALWYLHMSMVRTTSAVGAPGYGLPVGYFATQGSSGIAEDVAAGCAAAEAFERQGATMNGSAAVDPYVDDLARLVRRAFTTMTVRSAPLPSFADGNGNGISVVIPSEEMGSSWSACSQALARLGADFTAPTGPVQVVGRRLGDLAQDWADDLAANQYSDGSWVEDARSTMWATLALAADEKLGASVPDVVRSRLSNWTSQSWAPQSASVPVCGSTYFLTGGPVELSSTAAWLFESSYLGASPTSAPMLAGVGSLYASWSNSTNCAIAHDSVTTYAIQSALRALHRTQIANYDCSGQGGSTSFDWFSNPASDHTGIGPTLVTTQSADGHWTDAAAGAQDVCGFLFGSDARATALNTIALQSARADVQAAICDCGNLTYDINQDITLDGSCSSSLIPGRSVTRYEWDFRYGLDYPFSAPCDASVATCTISGGYASYGTQSVALRVTDNAGATDVATCAMVIKPPPHCPHASAGGGTTRRYSAAVGVPVTFDASSSFDPDRDPLTYVWSLNGNGVMGDATGAKASWTYNVPGLYAIEVQVTDHPELNALPYAAPDCTIPAFATVLVQ